jgi:hypothetical protein
MVVLIISSSNQKALSGPLKHRKLIGSREHWQFGILVEAGCNQMASELIA